MASWGKPYDTNSDIKCSILVTRGMGARGTANPTRRYCLSLADLTKALLFIHTSGLVPTSISTWIKIMFPKGPGDNVGLEKSAND